MVRENGIRKIEEGIGTIGIKRTECSLLNRADEVASEGNGRIWMRAEVFDPIFEIQPFCPTGQNELTTKVDKVLSGMVFLPHRPYNERHRKTESEISAFEFHSEESAHIMDSDKETGLDLSQM